MATTEIKPRMSDEAVAAKTGKTWSRWFKHLDAAGGKKMTHQEIVAHLRDKHDVRPWWTQMVAVTYEQARGLREPHEKPGGFEISVSRTMSFGAGRYYVAWEDERSRKRWLPANFTIRKATKNKSLRFDWEDGSTVAVAFLPKGKDKCQVVVQHGKLKDAKAGAKMKKYWAEALDRLRETIE